MILLDHLRVEVSSAILTHSRWSYLGVQLVIYMNLVLYDFNPVSMWMDFEDIFERVVELLSGGEFFCYNGSVRHRFLLDNDNNTKFESGLRLTGFMLHLLLCLAHYGKRVV